MIVYRHGAQSEMDGSRQYDVLTFGDMCVDLVVSGGDVVPRFGQAEQLVERYELEMGGSTCLFACQAAKLGLHVAVLGRVGDDDFGRLAVRRLAQCGVDTRHVHVDPSIKTGLGIALCSGDDRAILTCEGSISVLDPADVTDELLNSARHLHYGSFFLHTGLKPQAPAILARARALGLTTSLDTNWDPQERWNSTLADALAHVDLFLPNEAEAQAIARTERTEQAVARLRALDIPLIALKRGDKGAWAYDARGSYACAVEPAAPGGDSVGAGDSFDAGFLAGWLRGKSIQRCLEIGCQCGRSVASSAGGLRGQLTWDQVALPSGSGARLPGSPKENHLWPN
jgi:sugar/nucleoside kinase (ribokinase family)